jgi:hypothetical protein
MKSAYFMALSGTVRFEFGPLRSLPISSGKDFRFETARWTSAAFFVSRAIRAFASPNHGASLPLQTDACGNYSHKT